MKKLLIAFFVLFGCNLTFGQTTETRYFNENATKQQVLQQLNQFFASQTAENKTHKHSFVKTTGATGFIFSGIWTFEKDGITTSTTMLYTLDDISLTIKLVNSTYRPAKSSAITLTKNSDNGTIKMFYDVQVQLYINEVFQYLRINKNTRHPKTVSALKLGNNTNREAKQSRLYNGKYTKETALIAINKYIDNLKKIGTHSFVGGATKTYQIDAIWTQKITAQDKGTANIRYTIGDNGLTIELISAIVEKNGKAIMLYPQSPNETVRKLYDNQVNMFVNDFFKYLGINQNIATTTTNTTTSNLAAVSNSALSKVSANYLNTYKNNQEGTRQHLQQLYQQWVNEKYSTQQIVNAKANMIKEVYSVDKDAAFDIMMKMNKSIQIMDVFSKLSDEIKLFIKQKARDKISKATH